jgi:hypothetical protein
VLKIGPDGLAIVEALKLCAGHLGRSLEVHVLCRITLSAQGCGDL